MSRNPTVGRSVVCLLPQALHHFSRTTLAAAAIRSGLVCTGSQRAQGLKGLVKESPTTISQVVCTGMRMLADWPRSIQTFADCRLAELKDELSAYCALRPELQFIAGDESAEASALFQLAFPKLDGRKVVTFAKSLRYYTATEVKNLLSVSPSELKVLREAIAINYDDLPSMPQTRARYDANDVEEINRQLKSGLALGVAASRLDIPVYALDQFTAANTLTAQPHPALLVLRRSEILKTSVEALQRALWLAKISTVGPSKNMPLNFVPLKKAIARFPGEKPWGPIIKAMLNGTLPFHCVDAAHSIRNLLIPTDKIASLQLSIPAMENDPLMVTHVSLRDVCEMLCTRTSTAVEVIVSRMPVVKYGRGLGVEREQLRTLMAEVVFAGEIAAWTGRSSVSVKQKLTELRIPMLCGGWPRAALRDLGMVAAN
jgi:hypothetical protein